MRSRSCFRRSRIGPCSQSDSQCRLVLSDSEAVLGPGSVVVQRGTDHAWENRGETVARMAFFHIAAEFSDELLAKLPQPLSLME